jgi:predicted nucleic acid-binding protein
VIVLDASAVVALLLSTPLGRRVAEEIGSPTVTLHAPELLDIEVLQAVRRYVRLGAISPDRALISLEALQQLDITRYRHAELLTRIWALRENLTAYDAAYVSLAEALGAPLLTIDTRLAAAPGHQAEVRLLE